jgi:hypothetical protein
MKLSLGDRVFNSVNIGLMTLVGLLTLFPLYYVFVVSFTNPQEYIARGFVLFPGHWSIVAYQYIFSTKAFVNAIGVSGMLAIVGTLLSLLLTSSFAYDTFDRLDLWEDTLLIVNTDHGFLLGEHEWWGKNIQPFYNEIVNLPLFIWDPRNEQSSRRSDALVQTIDLPATLLDYFGIDLPPSMQGRPINEEVVKGSAIREAALFGISWDGAGWAVLLH